MTFDMLESVGLEKSAFNLSEKMSALRKGFESSVESKFDAYMDVPDYAVLDSNFTRWLGIDVATDLSAIRTSVIESAKKMYNGEMLDNGKRSLGLKEISKWKVNKEFKEQNINQHAGYAAEVIGTAKENIRAELEGSGIKTYRADDRPDLYARNDQYVDKIRVNSAGEIIEKIQVKFVGKNPKDCLSKLTSKKYDKYFNNGNVDKMEIPKEFFDEIKNQLIPDDLNDLEEQLQRVKKDGNEKAVRNIENRISRLQKIDEMIEQSTVTKEEAKYSVKHPERYTSKLFGNDKFAASHKAGIEGAALAVTITTAVSTVDNISKYMDGEITAQEAVVDVMKDTGIAGGAAYGTAFVSTAVAQIMSESSHQLIQSLGNSGIPATAISFGVQSYESVVDFATGTIDGKQLALDLGENAAEVAGSIGGAALTGAVVGSVVPGAGTVVGFATGMVGGMIGCAIASEAYASAVEFGAENADALADKAKEMAGHTIEIAVDVMPDHVGNITAAINDFAIANKLPFKI